MWRVFIERMQWNHMWKVLSELIRVCLLPLSTLNEGVAKFQVLGYCFLTSTPREEPCRGDVLGPRDGCEWEVGRSITQSPGVPGVLSRDQWFSNCHVPENHPPCFPKGWGQTSQILRCCSLAEIKYTNPESKPGLLCSPSAHSAFLGW